MNSFPASRPVPIVIYLDQAAFNYLIVKILKNTFC